MQPERAVRAWVGAKLYMFGIRIPKPQAPGPGQGLVINDRLEGGKVSVSEWSRRRNEVCITLSGQGPISGRGMWFKGPAYGRDVQPQV